MTTEPRPPAGWYPDPTNPGGQRYWDGNAWTARAAGPAGMAGPAVGPRPAGTEQLAVWSLVLSILGLFCFLGAIGGVICGHLALGAIRRNHSGGKGLAIAGLVIGYLFIALTVVVLLLVFLGGSTSS